MSVDSRSSPDMRIDALQDLVAISLVLRIARHICLPIEHFSPAMQRWDTTSKGRHCMVANEMQTRTCTFHLDATGIIRSTVMPGVEETLADAQENVRAVVALGRELPCPLLVDMRVMKSQEREARLYYSGPENAQAVSALALLSGSRVSTLIANFFIAVTKMTIPTKLFTDEAEAMAWLKGFLR